MAALSLADRDRIDGEKTVALLRPLERATLQQFPVEASPPVMVSLSGLLDAKFPPRRALLSPWLTTQSLSMIYAARGVGKTHVALGVAYALASGGEFLGWSAPEAVPVAYIDGEMPGADLCKRMRAIEEAASVKAAPEFLRFMTPDLQPCGVMPNLYFRDGQDAVTEAAGDAKVIVIDNLSCLVRGGRENEGESWQPVAEWALRMRASGRSVLFIHHAGKGGGQRGSSRREDILDTVIALRKPSDYSPEQGARFEIHYEKARALCGEDVSPVEAALETGIDGAQMWTMRSAADGFDENLLEMMNLGLSQTEAATELGVNKSTVSRALRRLEDEGRFTQTPRRGGRPRKAAEPRTCPRCDGEGCEHCGNTGAVA